MHKILDDYKGLYILNHDLKVVNIAGGPGRTKNKILKPYHDQYGYLKVRLSKNQVVKNVLMHRIIAQELIPNPDNKPCINHKNGIKDDNRIENLEWVTYKENTAHSWSTGLQKNRRGWNSKISINILDFHTGIFYPSIKEASIARCIPHSSLAKKLAVNPEGYMGLSYV